MWEPEVAEGALVQGLCVLASASQPGSDRGLPVLLLRRLFRLHVRSCVGSPAQHVVEHACDKRGLSKWTHLKLLLFDEVIDMMTTN